MREIRTFGLTRCRVLRDIRGVPLYSTSSGFPPHAPRQSCRGACAIPRLQSSLAFLPIEVNGQMFLFIYLILLVAGLVIGLIGSALAMRRYLKV